MLELRRWTLGLKCPDCGKVLMPVEIKEGVFLIDEKLLKDSEVIGTGEVKFLFNRKRLLEICYSEKDGVKMLRHVYHYLTLEDYLKSYNAFKVGVVVEDLTLFDFDPKIVRDVRKELGKIFNPSDDDLLTVLKIKFRDGDDVLRGIG